MELDPTSPVSLASASEIDDPFIQYLTKGSINRLEADEQQDLNNRTFSGKKSRKKTKKSKVDTNKIHKCSQCPFSTLYRCDFRRHLERHKKKSFACSECNMPFMTLGHLNGHKESAHGIKRPSDKIVWRNCEKCKYKTRHSSDMARHRRRHDSALDSCKYCNRPFCHLGRLKEHIKREHGDTGVQSANSNEKRSVETCKEAESVTETNDVTNYRAIDNTMDRECKDSYSKEECKISNQMQALKQCVLYEDGSSRQKSVNNKRGRDKVTFKKKNKPSQTGRDSADLYTENADKTGKDIRSVIGKTNKMICQHDLTCQEDKNSKRVDPRQMKKCAFCGFSTSSYNDLKQHLDEHDIVELSDESDTDIERVSRGNDIDNVNIDYVENSNLSGRSITIIDDEVNMMLHEVEDSTQAASESDEAFIQDEETSNTNNDLQQSDTDVDDEMETEDDVPISKNATNNGGTNIRETELKTIKPDGKVQNDTYSTDIIKNDDCLDAESVVDIDTDEFVDAVTILNGCVAKFESQSSDLFPMKPFACSKCFFMTGNLEYLKIHVEAHLFETRWEQCQK